jgi:hypothetical protein
MKTVKVICKKTEGNKDGFYVCNADQVPKGAKLVADKRKVNKVK